VPKFRKLTEKELSEEPKCCYEFYDKEKHAMIKCGKPAVWTLGVSPKSPLCEEHGRFVGSLNTKTMDNETYKRFKSDGQINLW
jgi:hypothetical protein